MSAGRQDGEGLFDLGCRLLAGITHRAAHLEFRQPVHTSAGRLRGRSFWRGPGNAGGQGGEGPSGVRHGSSRQRLMDQLTAFPWCINARHRCWSRGTASSIAAGTQRGRAPLRTQARDQLHGRDRGGNLAAGIVPWTMATRAGSSVSASMPKAREQSLCSLDHGTFSDLALLALSPRLPKSVPIS